MQTTKATFKKAWPYQNDAMNLPVADVNSSVSFYERIMGFKVAVRNETPMRSVILERDLIKMGLAENGGDPTQDGCFFEVDSVVTAYEELKVNGLEKEISNFEIQKYGDTSWKVFFVIAPDGLCFCLGEKLP
jgi:predicted enzyme related to lactoylglutathione lyase